MPRPRTSDGLKPPLQTRLRIARAHGRRRFPLLFERYRQDAEQAAWLIALQQFQKHLTLDEFQRLCGREWYATARDYGFRRAYRTGNLKTGWYPAEESLNADAKGFFSK